MAPLTKAILKGDAIDIGNHAGMLRELTHERQRHSPSGVIRRQKRSLVFCTAIQQRRDPLDHLALLLIGHVAA